MSTVKEESSEAENQGMLVKCVLRYEKHRGKGVYSATMQCNDDGDDEKKLIQNTIASTERR